MTEQSTLAAFADIVNEATGIPADRVKPQSSFTDDLDIDSLSMVEIATMAEDKFGVAIPDSELSNLKTVDDVLQFLAKAGVAA